MTPIVATMKRQLLLCILLISLLSFVLWITRCPSTLDTNFYQHNTLERREKNEESWLEEVEVSRRSFCFLKTHKCGSSTVQNIILRYALEEGKDLALPARFNYIGYPSLFSEAFIGPRLVTPDHKYDVITHHTRYEGAAMRRVLRGRAVFFTVLREPASLFESLYNYYKFDTRLQANLTELLDEGGTPALLQLMKWRFQGRIGLNQMSHDLGLDPIDFNNKEVIRWFIDNIEKDFDLVMIFEEMDASLVLLASLLEWPLERVVSLKLNSRNEAAKLPLSPREKAQIREANHADTLLYQHFYEIFRMRVSMYGTTRMNRDLARLRSLKEEAWDACILGTKDVGRSLTYRLKPNVNSTCQHFVKSELSFTDEVRKKQELRLAQLRQLTVESSTQGFV